MSDHHVRWSSFNGEHHYVDHIYYMIHVRPYRSPCSEAISYNATVVLSKIRCIKDKHHMQSKYVTWYGHRHLVLVISISEASS